MNIEKKLGTLKQIKQVDAPPFLLTRIRQQIDNLANVEAPVKWKWAFALSSLMILVLNISILLYTNNKTEVAGKSNGLENVIKSMDLTTTNELYHE